jgi:hypothetical protein
VRECLVGFDQRPDLGIERTVPETLRQLDAEDLEEPSDLLLEIDALGEHCLAAGEQSPDMVTLDALDVHAAVPAAPEQLRDASRIVSVLLRIAESAAFTCRASMQTTSKPADCRP